MPSLRWKRAMMRRRESDRGTLHLEDLEQSRCRRFHFVFRVPEPLPFALSKWRLYFLYFEAATQCILSLLHFCF